MMSLGHNVDLLWADDSKLIDCCFPKTPPETNRNNQKQENDLSNPQPSKFRPGPLTP